MPVEQLEVITAEAFEGLETYLLVRLRHEVPLYALHPTDVVFATHTHTPC